MRYASARLKPLPRWARQFAKPSECVFRWVAVSQRKPAKLPTIHMVAENGCDLPLRTWPVSVWVMFRQQLEAVFRLHKMTSHLQLISGYLEMADYAKALGKTRETIKELHALATSLTGLANVMRYDQLTRTKYAPVMGTIIRRRNEDLIAINSSAVSHTSNAGLTGLPWFDGSFLSLLLGQQQYIARDTESPCGEIRPEW